MLKDAIKGEILRLLNDSDHGIDVDDILNHIELYAASAFNELIDSGEIDTDGSRAFPRKAS